jgi:hypothetical protein
VDVVSLPPRRVTENVSLPSSKFPELPVQQQFGCTGSPCALQKGRVLQRAPQRKGTQTEPASSTVTLGHTLLVQPHFHTGLCAHHTRAMKSPEEPESTGFRELEAAGGWAPGEGREGQAAYPLPHAPVTRFLCAFIHYKPVNVIP